jgi:hypothetical protein
MAELGKSPKRQRRHTVPAEEQLQAPDAQLERKKISAALMQIATKALVVSPRDVDVYAPRELDLRIAEAMLAGAITYKAIGEILEESPPAIARYMRDPLVCAWISRTVHGHVQHRLGMVDAAMLNRAMAGSTSAAKLLYERYGQMVQRSVNINIGGKGVDFSKFEDADLDAFIKDANKNAGIIEIAGGEDQAPSGDRGAEEA